MFKRLRERIKNIKHWEVLCILFIVALLSAIFSASAKGWQLDAEWWSGFWQGLTTEMIGAAVTFLLINLILEERNKRDSENQAMQRERDKQDKEKREKKRDLIYQLKSQVNGDGIRAAQELWNNGWLQDGSLRGADLSNAKLQGADLVIADMQEVRLVQANLRRARLTEAKLQRANLYGAILEEASLDFSDLSDTNLSHANLQNATMWDTDLRKAKMIFCNLSNAVLSYETKMYGANLLEANLSGLYINGDNFDESTILPDGTTWTSNTDMNRFTDSSHPNFWRSNDPTSPSYRGSNTK